MIEMSGLAQDIRFALRQARKSPGFTAIGVVMLALGIGGNTAIFSLINAVMLRTLPVKDPGRLVLLKWKAKSIPKTKSSSNYANCPPGSGPNFQGGDINSDVPLDTGGCSFSFPFFQQLRSEKSIFSNVAAFVPVEVTVNSESRTSWVHGLIVSGDFFPMLGVRPALGRLLDQNDDSASAAPAVIISHRFWQNTFGGDAFIAGKQILIGKTLFTVAGVTSPEFAQLDPGLPCDLWLPLAFRSTVPPYQSLQKSANVIWLEVMARLQAGVSARQATSALSTTFAAGTVNGSEAIFKPNDAPQVELANAAHGLATLRRFFSQMLFALLAAVAVVLFLSCVNIAGLMSERAVSRRKELGMRVALGASRSRILSHLLWETLLLSLAGGAAGFALGNIGSRLLVAFFSRNWSMPLHLDVRPDVHVFVFTVLISALAALTCGLVPAFSVWRADLVPVLRRDKPTVAVGTRRPLTLGRLIVLVQIALAMPILAAAGLVTRTLANLESEHVGFNTANLVVFRIDSTYSAKNPNALYRDLQKQLQSLPGVVSVSRSGVALLSEGGMAAPIVSNDQPSLQVRAHGLPMSSDFLTTLGIPLREGHVFGEEDSESTRSKSAPTPVVVNETLVRQLFGSRDPLGKYFHVGNGSGPTFEIIGVVGDAKYMGVREAVWPTVYMPLGDWNGPVYFEVRTGMDPEALIPEIQSAIRRFDSNLLTLGMKTETEQINQDLYQERLISSLSGLFALLALIIACVGLYGLLAFQVTRRSQEIGIRMALGAGRTDVLRLVLGQGTLLAVTGTSLGSMVALGLTRYIQSFLFGLKPADPPTLVAVAGLLVAVAVLASYIPARRAAKVDPMVALRYE